MFEKLLYSLLSIATRIKNPMVINEHFIPKLGMELRPYLDREDMTGVHHILRYRWAVHVIEDLKDITTLLDVACGAGYGTYELAKHFPDIKVVGVDYDKTALKYARKNYQLPNLTFQFGDVLKWDETIGSETFDCVTSFDTLEHVAHREIMMENMVNHMSKKACLLMSTPCGEDENNLRPRWPIHKIEFSSGSLFDFLNRYFQFVYRPDAAIEEKGTLHLDVFDVLEGEKVNYNLRMNPVLCCEPIKIDNPYN